MYNIVKKRGILIVFLILLSLFFINNSVAQQDPLGTCADPYNPYFCEASSITQAGCCPLPESPDAHYADPGAPETQEDCIANFFAIEDVTVAGKCTNIGCCFIETEDQCQEYLEGYCIRSEGTFYQGTCLEIDPPECQQGCCCYTKQSGSFSRITTKGRCAEYDIDPYYSNFYSTISGSTACSAKCEEEAPSEPEPEPGLPECSDGIDNDDDGMIDYQETGGDPGCTSANDESEKESTFICDDGKDNDGDGQCDYAGCCKDSSFGTESECLAHQKDWLPADSCCLSPTYDSEEICDLPSCPAGQIGDARCNCNGIICEPQAGVNIYCCAGVCQNQPCGVGKCSTGSLLFCNKYDAEGCKLYKTCVDGLWSTSCFFSDPMCTYKPELCNNDFDDDLDGKTDCEDPDCYGMVCSEDNPDVCEGHGYYDSINTLYRCCGADEVNNCENPPDEFFETCGPCNCLKLKVPAILKPIEHVRGKHEFEISWILDCNTEFNIKRCNPLTSNCNLTENYQQLNDEPTTERTFTDPQITAETEYCYLVESIYEAGELVESNVECLKSGHETCLINEDDHFCLRDEPEQARHRYMCDKANNLMIEESCAKNEICMGPYDDGQTRCVFKSVCDACGDPLGEYGDKQSTTECQGLGCHPECIFNPVCYFDYARPNVDAYDECVNVRSCYDYSSEYACQKQTNTIDNSINNKCLTRGCLWELTNNVLNLGICQETKEKYKKCEYCNDAENNRIFDDCTIDRCQLFSHSDTYCYLKRELSGNRKCVDSRAVSCIDYLDQADCTSGQNVEVDVVYTGDYPPARYAGTNTITALSQDALGFGVCRWNNSYENAPCFKDADGDEHHDPLPFDMTPPLTQILSPEKIKNSNLTIVVFDPAPRGKNASGVLNFYYCTDDDYSCYPNISIPDIAVNGTTTLALGLSHGYHDLYYYAIDKAHNLEQVKKFHFEVDRSPPEITIEYTVTPDIYNFKDSKVTFEISVNEDVVCTDKFETAALPEIDHEFGNKFQATYVGLKDGYYRYVVMCVDTSDNPANASVVVRVDADQQVFNPLPFGLIDYNPVVLSINTLTNIECRWGNYTGSFAELTEFSPGELQTMPDSTSYYYLQYENHHMPTEGEYSYDVVCSLPERYSFDEIQFVYDHTAPVTTAVDGYGKIFNFSRWYAQGIQDEIYLECKDTPEFGYGCDKTLLCLTDKTQKCDPDVEYNPLYKVEYNLSEELRQWLCFYSIENTFNAMGGLKEKTQCHEIKIDIFPPIIDVKKIKSCVDSLIVPSGCTTFASMFELEGKVIDEDTQRSGNSDNTLTIVVVAENGQTQTYTMPANNDFFQIINLSLGINAISLTAVDRAGQTSETYTYYIKKTEFTGEKIKLIAPTLGVSKTEIFDLIIRTHMTAECKFSFTEGIEFESMTPFIPVEDNHHLYPDFSLEGFPEAAEIPLYVECEYPDKTIAKETLLLSYDTSPPKIQKLYVYPSDGKDPATVVDYPLETNLIAETDDKTRCKYSDKEAHSFETQMSPFNGAAFYTQELNKTNAQPFKNLVDQTTYINYVQCENGAGELTGKKKITFKVDTTAATGINIINPPKLSDNTTFSFFVITSRKSTGCTYKEQNSTESIPMTTSSDGKEHASGQITLEHGKYTYYFECMTAKEGAIQDSYTFTIDITPPLLIEIDDGNQSPYLDKLIASWNFLDNESGVDKYNFTIGSLPGYSDIANMSTTTDTSAIADDLNLTNLTSYYWNVKARNKLGHWSEFFSSNGVLVNTSFKGDLLDPTPDDGSCFNNEKDANETDVDCGGVCSPCANDYKCLVDSDCLSSMCINSLCVAAECNDDQLNQQETDVDCGGPQCNACEEGQKCLLGNDCKSKSCMSGYCVAPTCDDGIMNGDEQGTDCGGSCPEECEKTEEFCEVDEKSDVDCDGLPDEWEELYFGCTSCARPEEDPDNDNISNLEEYKNNTDPTKSDKFPWFLVIMLLLLLIAAGLFGYYAFVVYYQKKPNPYQPVIDAIKDKLIALGILKKPRMPPPMMRAPAKAAVPRRPGVQRPPQAAGFRRFMPRFVKSPMQKKMEEMAKLKQQKIREQKKKQRADLLKAFEEKPKTEKIEERPKSKKKSALEELKKLKGGKK